MKNLKIIRNNVFLQADKFFSSVNTICYIFINYLKKLLK